MVMIEIPIQINGLTSEKKMKLRISILNDLNVR